MARRLTPDQLSYRRSARACAETALANINRAVKYQHEADTWREFERKVKDQSARQYAGERAATDQQIADDEARRAGANGRRAFHYALKAQEGVLS